MSKILSSYSFLPWLRIGISNQINADDKDPAVKLRAPIDVDLTIKADGQPVNPSITQKVGLYGPADIVGIDSKAIVRTDPRDWITNFEPNYLASIEFYDEDFLWRYTPAKPDNKDRLRPWLTLVVLKDGEFDNGKNMADRPLPYIEIKENAADLFPPADQLWAWSHVHVDADLIEDDKPNPEDPANPIQRVVPDVNDASMIEKIKTEYQSVYKKDPDAAYSRIMCPRRLEANTGYHAFLIPTFESGRLAGLGLDVEGLFEAENSPLYATFSAWENYQDKQEATYFPIYYRWYFKTGTVGDFEYLVRLLEPKPVDNRVGRRDMDVTRPEANIDGIGDDDEDGIPVPQLGGILRLGGALRIPLDTMDADDRAEYDKYDQWATPYPRQFQKQLAAFINLADEYSKNAPKLAHANSDLPDAINETASEDEPDPLITAPLYGRWHALTNRLLKPADGIPDDNWTHELNLDPRFRVPAGFGTRVIQQNQEKYMESAWEQVGAVIEANRKIRQAQFAQFISKYWFATHLKSFKKTNSGTLLWLTQPIQTRVLYKGLSLEGKEEVLTAHHHVKTSKVPAVAFSPSMRKFTRPRGRLVKALPFDRHTAPETELVNRINKNKAFPAPRKRIAEVLPTLEQVVDKLKQAQFSEFVLNWIEKFKWLKFVILALALILVALVVVFVGSGITATPLPTSSIATIGLLAAGFLLWLFFRILEWEKQIARIDNMKEENQTPEAVDRYPKKPGFHLSRPGQGITFETGSTDSDEAERFKTAQKDVGELLQQHIEASVEPLRPDLNLEAIVNATLQGIDPQTSIPDFILKNQVVIPERLKLDFHKETFKEAMAYPVFDSPMYKALIDISSDLFLPNINYIQQNSISLLETNQKFTEAYMVGLNHEFARELLWREYPTDQRGSCFRQFWDVSDFMFEQNEINQMVSEIKNEAGEDADAELIAAKLKDKIKERLRDIPKLHKWSKYSKLGQHDHREKQGENKQEVVLVIRGELLKKYPNAVIYAHKAKWKPKSDTDNTPDKAQERELVPIDPNMSENPSKDKVKFPLYEAKVDPDIYFFGFDIDIKEAFGLTEGEPAHLDDRPGWFFVIKERPGEPRFGLDIGTTAEGELEVWNDMAWGNVTPAVDAAVLGSQYLQITPTTTEIDVSDDAVEDDDDEKFIQREEDKQLTWHQNMNSAEVAYVLFQAPVMVAVHAAEMLPKPQNE